jgi:EAL domain-containing protein (putative c-di-GMP-specific phosphodiesterase class I)
VETAEQMCTLKKMGCAIIQGYYFSRPLPAEEFEVFIAERKEIEAPAEAASSLTREDN